MNFIERKKIENEEKFKKMITKYRIPENFKDPAKVFTKKAGSILKDYKKIYDRMQYDVPKETGEIIQKLFEDDTYMLGIHRTVESPETVFNRGIKMRGTDFTDNVQVCGYLPFILEQIKVCENYKLSSGCFIVQIPLNNDKPIYFINETENGKEYYLLPEYIAGYVPVRSREVGNMILNPNYTKDHEYSDIGLAYDEVNRNSMNTRKSK